MQAETIHQAVSELTNIAESSKGERSPIGCFAAFWSGVAGEVRDRIGREEFDDNARAEKMFVGAVNRYLEAVGQSRAGEKCAHAWELAFAAAKLRQTIVLQHLLLGLNAHLGLDLPVAAAEALAGADAEDIEEDFGRVFDAVAERFEIFERDLNRISPYMGLLDQVGGRSDAATISFSLAETRKRAWSSLRELAGVEANKRGLVEQDLDRAVEDSGRAIRYPGIFAGLSTLIIGLAEESNTAKVIEALARV